MINSLNRMLICFVMVLLVTVTTTNVFAQGMGQRTRWGTIVGDIGDQKDIKDYLDKSIPKIGDVFLDCNNIYTLNTTQTFGNVTCQGKMISFQNYSMFSGIGNSKGVTGFLSTTPETAENNDIVLIGEGAGSSLTKGMGDIFIGRYVGSKNTIGSFNTGIGSLSFIKNITGHGNTTVGHNTLCSLTNGSFNTVIGAGAMNKNSGSRNIALGALSGYNTTGSGNIFIGYKSGCDSTNDNKLYIAQDTKCLIEGDFSNTTLLFNASLTFKPVYKEVCGKVFNISQNGSVININSLLMGYEFSKVATNNNDNIGYIFNMPSDVTGLGVKPHIHYWQKSVSDTNIWKITYSLRNVGSVTYTNISETVITNGANIVPYVGENTYQVFDFPTITNVTLKAGDNIVIKVYRNYDNGVGGIVLGSLDISYESSKIGSESL